MAIHRHAARRDHSEAAIVEALVAFGFSVSRLSARGVPDLLLGRGGITRVAEVKTGRKRLDESQVDWWAGWCGNSLIVLRSIEDVERLAQTWFLRLVGVDAKHTV